MSFLFSLLCTKLHPPCDPTASFAGQTVLVTGANSGLGFEAAVKFVSLGASTVILACRTLAKGEEAKSQIENRIGRKDVCKVLQLDLDSFESIRQMVIRLQKGRLDVALLNAGVIQPGYHVSKEGWEETLQVNVLGTALLALLLLPMLQAKTTEPLDRPRHLCFVSSGNFASAALPPHALESSNLLQFYNQEEHFGGPEPQYNISKIFLMYVAGKIAALVDNDADGYPSLVVNSVNPGAASTNLGRNITGIFLRIVVYVYLNLLARTAEEGSRSLVSACLLGSESHAQLWQDDTIQK